MGLFTFNTAKAWSPDTNIFHPDQVMPDALITQTATLGASIQGDDVAVRVGVVDDAEAVFVTEGNDIPEADPTLSERLVVTGKIAQLARVSNEQWYQQNTGGVLADSVRRAVLNKANSAYINQAAPAESQTSPKPSPGLINTPDIIDGGTLADNLDGLVDVVATVETNGACPSHILVAPTTWAALRKLKVGKTSAQSLLGAGTEDAAPHLLGIPVIVSSAIPEKTGLVIDKRNIVSALGPIEVSMSKDRYFEKDSVALRCTWRIGHVVIRPNRLAKFKIA